MYPWFAAASQVAESARENAPGYYPPALTGMRGSHPGSFEVGHALRDGNVWDADAVNLGETYDLVVVGGGISGLAAAYRFRQLAGGDASVLVIDNHDDFGGHAKRNEFAAGGRLLIGYGGTQSIEAPSRYSQGSKQLLKELGIDTEKVYVAFDQKLYGALGLGPGVFFNREAWGSDRLVRIGTSADGPEAGWWRQFAASAPFTEDARKDFVRLYESNEDYLPNLSPDEKRARLRRTSYRDFLRDIVKVHPQVIEYFQQRPHPLYGVGIEAVSSTSQIASGGFQGMGLTSARPSVSTGAGRVSEPYIFHFPDGNASIARLLVRQMIP